MTSCSADPSIVVASRVAVAGERSACWTWHKRRSVSSMERVSEFRPDLVLLDLMMPEMDGFTFIEAFRSRPDAADIPVIVVTAADLSEADAARLSGKVDEIVRKSGRELEDIADELRQRVARIVGAGGQAEGDSK